MYIFYQKNRWFFVKKSSDNGRIYDANGEQVIKDRYV